MENESIIPQAHFTRHYGYRKKTALVLFTSNSISTAGRRVHCSLQLFWHNTRVAFLWHSRPVKQIKLFVHEAQRPHATHSISLPHLGFYSISGSDLYRVIHQPRSLTFYSEKNKIGNAFVQILSSDFLNLLKDRIFNYLFIPSSDDTYCILSRNFPSEYRYFFL